MVLVWAISISVEGPGYDAHETLAWEDAQHDPNPAYEDLDGNGIPDILQWYPNPFPFGMMDYDADGMGDLWEHRWARTDAETGERTLYGLDPTDAIEDPDGDGHDFDGNGRIDVSSDLVIIVFAEYPENPDYTPVSVEDLLSSPGEYLGHQVHLHAVWVVENGTYASNGDRYEAETQMKVADLPQRLGEPNITVVMEEYSWRPKHLTERSPNHGNGRMFAGSQVDVYGLFTRDDEGYRVIVRGTEGFPNFLECYYRFYDGDKSVPAPLREYNMTDPMDPDTDDDGMADGWEARYGEKTWDGENNTWRWRWHLNPTCPGDADEDADGDGWTNLQEFRRGTSPVDPSSPPS